MPPLPPGLREWFGPSAFLALLALLLGLQGKRIDELRADLKASEARQQQEMKELRADLKASEARQQQDMKELRAELKADNRVLSEKMDRLIEALLAVKQA